MQNLSPPMIDQRDQQRRDDEVMIREIRALYGEGDAAAARRKMLTIVDMDGLINTPMPIIHEVCKTGDALAFRYLFRRGVPVNALDHLKRTPGHLAARYGHLEILQVWRAAGGDVEAIDTQGHGLLELACQGRHRRILEWLLGLGLRAERVDPTSGGLLHVAMEHELPGALVRLICRAGAPVNVQDEVGNTPLHLAVESGLVESALILLEAGADPTLINALGLTADVMPQLTDHAAGYRRAVSLSMRQRWSYQLMQARARSRLVPTE